MPEGMATAHAADTYTTSTLAACFLNPELKPFTLQANRFGLSRGKDAKKAAANAADAEPTAPDFSAKLLHLAWHPQAPLIAAAGAC